jgi:hypothetical protein
MKDVTYRHAGRTLWPRIAFDSREFSDGKSTGSKSLSPCVVIPSASLSAMA